MRGEGEEEDEEELEVEEDEAEFEGDVMFGAFAEACPDFAAEEALAGAFPAFGETGARAGAFPAFPFTLAFATTVFAEGERVVERLFASALVTANAESFCCRRNLEMIPATAC